MSSTVLVPGGTCLESDCYKIPCGTGWHGVSLYPGSLPVIVQHRPMPKGADTCLCSRSTRFPRVGHPTMPRQNVYLSKEDKARAEEAVEQGEYDNISQAVREMQLTSTGDAA